MTIMQPDKILFILCGLVAAACFAECVHLIWTQGPGPAGVHAGLFILNLVLAPVYLWYGFKKDKNER